MSNQFECLSRAANHRRSIRLKEYDYSWVGWYYVTICTSGRACLFGELVNDAMVLNKTGKIVEEEWLKTTTIRPEVELDHYVIMPNHMHGIVVIGESVNQSESNATEPVGTHGRASLRRLTRMPRSLSSFIAGFKSAATKRINIERRTPGIPIWQGRFYEHIIRNDVDLHRIREHIVSNPLRWSLDEEYPENL